MRKRFLLVFCIYIVSQVAVAQCKFSMTLSINGCSNTLDGRVAERTAEALFNHYMEQASMGFNSLQECNTARNIILSELDIKDGNCRIRVNVSPCSGCSSMNFNSADILAIGQGSSFFSTNGVNEIRDWSNDDMERLLALNPEYKPKEPNTISTGDIAFDNLIENMPYSDEAFSGRMLRGSTHIMTDGNITATGQPVKGKGVLVPDDFTSRPFKGLGEWSSSDLSTVNIDLSSNVSMDNSYGIDEKSGSWSNLLGSLDSKLDYYNALEQGDANFLQYMYTRWGKENVMEGIYWWEKNNMSDRISNAYNSIQDAIANTVLHPIDTYNNVRDGAIEKIKDNVDVGVGSTVRFLLPPQYKETGERAQAIYDTEKGIITDVLETVKEAPDKISRGETIDITQTLGKYNDRVQGLAASYGSSEMSKAYGKLKSTADINNLPQEKQKKGLLDMFKKEGKGMAKSEFKKSGYYKKLENKSKKIVDPYNFFFD